MGKKLRRFGKENYYLWDTGTKLAMSTVAKTLRKNGHRTRVVPEGNSYGLYVRGSIKDMVTRGNW